MSEVEEIVHGIMDDRERARGLAVSSVEDDPEQASRAIHLSQASGVPAPAILGDYEGFDASYKRKLTSEIIRNNEHLINYVNADPMHSKVSSDDYGQLDTVSEQVTKMYGGSQLARISQIPTAVGNTVMQAAIKGAKEGFGEGGVGSWILDTESGREYNKASPLSAATLSVLASPVELVLRSLSGAIKGATTAAAEGTTELATQLGMAPSQASRLGRDIGGLVEQKFNEPTHLAHPIAQEAITKAREVMLAAKPYLDAGVEPPAGLHKIIDDIKLEQTDLDLKNLDDAFKEAQGSKTRERNPEIFASFVRQHTNASIGISGDAVRKLYGDKPPLPDDGILGWVPKLEEQLAISDATGGDVHIPLADWLAKADPEVAKELHDDIRVRPGGITKEEGKRAAEVRTQEPDVEPTKAVDEQGNPLTLYHGTVHPNIKEFEVGYNSWGNKDFKGNHRVISFSTDPEFANRYAGDKPGASIYPVNIDVKNPGDFRNPEHVAQLKQYTRERELAFIERAKASYPEIWTPEIIKEHLEKTAKDADKLIEHGAWQVWENPGAWKRFGWDGAWTRESPGHIHAKTLNLAVAEGKQVRPKFVNPIEAIREASSLKPMFQLDERKLALKKTLAVGEFHEYDIVNEKGGKVAELMLSLSEDGKTLSVDNIYGMKGYGPQSLGPSLMRDLLRQIRDEFPTAERLKGYRVTGAREKAGSVDTQPVVELPLKTAFEEVADKEDAIGAFFDELIKSTGRWQTVAGDTKARFIPKEAWTLNEVMIDEAVRREAIKLGLQDVEIGVAHEIRRVETGKNVHGIFAQFEDKVPLILMSLESKDHVGTLRHEAIHHLRREGFFTNSEWATLMEGAIDQDWMKKYNIDKRYKDLSTSEKIEEAIAEGFREWERGGEVSTGIKAIFEKFKALLEAIKRGIREVLGKEPTWQDLFKEVDEGKIGARDYEPGTGKEGTAAQNIIEPSYDDLFAKKPIEERELFSKANAIGMTVDQYSRYMKLIEKRQTEDLEKQSAKLLKEETKRQSAEWKANKEAMRPEVVANINNRPDIAADRMFREGILFDQKMDQALKLRSDLLTPEQRAALPKEYLAKDGVHPDDVASLFGYPSGQAMIDSLGALNKSLKDSNMRPMDFKRRMIDAELERQMQAKYGSLDENILQEAKDQVLSQTQLDLLHEEVLALGTKAGGEISISKEALKSWAEDSLREMPLRDVSVDKFLAAAGKVGKEAEMALLKGKYQDAFKEKQRQYLAILMANEMKAVEKEQAKFEKLAKRLSAREVKGIDQEFTNYAQLLLAQAELPVKRTIQEIVDASAAAGHKSLESFVSSKNSDGWDLAVDDRLQAGSVKKFGEMSVGEFQDFKDAIDSLVHVGREVKKIDIAGEKKDFEDWKAGVIENITSLPARDKNKAPRFIYKFDAMQTRMEEMIKDLDLRQELGPLFNAVIRPMMMAKSKEYAMTEALTNRLKEIKGYDRKWQRTLSDTIPQDFFLDPYDATPFDFTRENMIQAMLNWGNKSNISKFIKGYGSPEVSRLATKEEAKAFEGKMWDLIETHATEQDWKYVQSIWDIFKGFQKDADTVYRNTSGVAPKWIETQPVQTRHGTFDGGYYPVIYDKLRSNIGVIRDKSPPDTGTLGADYYRASTSKGYTKERTGYNDRLDVTGSIESLGLKMQQVIHDIAFREAMIESGKVLYDRQIRGAIRKHYGPEYEDQLVPWLKRIANHFNQDEVAVSAATSFLRRARINLVGHTLPLNLKVIGSPDVGAVTPNAYARWQVNRSANVELAMTKSNEIPHTIYNMDRDFTERLEQTVAKKGWSGFQADSMRWGYGPMVKFSQEFRMITFVEKYNEALGRGLDEKDAAALADTYVRERHGAASVVDLPAVMQSTEAMKLMTTFYGFFNTMYNWQRQLPGAIKRGEWNNGMNIIYGSIILPAAFGALLFNQSKESDSWFKIIGKALVLQPLSTMVGVREAANYMIEGMQPRTPLESVISAFNTAIGDTKKWLKKEEIKKPISHAANVVGLTTGLPLAQAGRSSQFLYDAYKGKQRPRNILEWIRGIVHGEAKLKP